MKSSTLKRKSLIGVAVLAGLSHQSLAAEQTTESDIERIAVVKQRQAYRGDVPLKELPQSVDIISEELLDSMGILDLQSALKFSSSIARQNNFGGLWDSFAIRGFAGDENSPSGYLVNGFNVGRGFSGKRDASNIETIEVLKGPGSALYGRGEPGGTINVITKKPQFEPEGYIEATAGSYQLHRLEGDFTDALTSDIAFRINGSYQDAESFRDRVESKALALTPSVLYVLDPKTSLFYEMEVTEQEAPFDRGIVVPDYNFDAVPINTFYGEPADGPMEVSALGHQLTLQRELQAGWNLTAGVSYRDSSFEGYSTEMEPSRARQLLYTDGETVSRQRRYRDYDTTDLSARLELSGRIETGKLTHHIMMGADTYDYQIDQIMNRWRPSAGSSTYSVSLLNPQYGQPQPELAALINQTEQQQSVGLYIQDQIDLSERWKMLLGLRLDDSEKEFENLLSATATKQKQNVTSPRLGAVYVANDNISFYVSYSEGFRPNSGADINDVAFEPEESESYEAGVKFNTLNNNVSGTVAIFHADKSNILTADPVNSGYSAALGKAESEGIELDINTYVNEGTSLSLSYAYIDASTSNSVINIDWGVEVPAGSQLINIPKHTLNLIAKQDFNLAGKDSSVSASLSYIGERLGETIDADYVLPGYTKVDVSSTVKLQENLTLKLVLDNLLDKKYFDNSYSALWTQPGAPRTARLSLKYQF